MLDANRIISGPGNPSPNGTYTPIGTYNGQTAYQRTIGGYWLWYNIFELSWTVSVNKGDDEDYWQTNLVGIPGDYAPYGIFAGIIHVA